MIRILFIILLFATQSSFLSPIIDSNMSRDEALFGSKAPDSILNSMVLLDVMYYSFDEKLHKGQIVVHKEVEDEVIIIFNKILNERFPIAKCIPIVKYEWDDDASMEDNNSSGFNYRNIANTNRLSKHSFGKAIDINPFQNPVVYASGKIQPESAKYNPKAKGTFSDDCPIVKEFKRFGWRWGGNFQSFKDYHHFDKD